MVETPQKARSKRRLTKIKRPEKKTVMKMAKWAAGIVAAFAIIGFFVLPPAVRYFGVRILADTLGRKVVIERVRINPFALSMTVDGVTVAEADGEGSALSFATLYANLEVESLIRGGPVLRELRLEAPHVRFTRLAPGRNNWSDVIERFTAKPQPVGAEKRGARFSINNIRIVDGDVVLEDRLVGLTHELSAINIGLPFLSNLPAKVDLFVDPQVSALVNGRPLHVAGRTRPFSEDRETMLDVTLDGFDFTPYVAYLPFDAAFKVPEGRLTTRLELSFSQPADAAPIFRVKGVMELAGFRMQSANGDSLLSVPVLTLNVADVQPLAGRWHFDRLEIARPEIDAVRLADGTLNFQKIIPQRAKSPKAGEPDATRGDVKPAAPGTTAPDAAAPARTSTNEGATSAPVFTLDHAKIVGATLWFDDRAAKAPFHTELKDLVVEANNLSSAPAAVADIAVDFTTAAGEMASHRGTLSIAPLALRGRIAVGDLVVNRYAPYYAAALPGGEIRDGRVDATVRYSIDAGPKDVRTGVLAESIVLRRFELALKGREQALVTLPRLAVTAADISLTDRSAKIGAIESKGANLALVKARDGRFDAQALFAVPDGAVKPARRETDATADSPQAAWSVALDRLALDDWAVRFEDRTQDAPIVLQAKAIGLTAENLGTAKGTSTTFKLDARVNEHGRAAASGTLGITPLAGKLRVDLRNVDLLPLQPYVVDQFNIAISRGNVTAKGQLDFETAGDGMLKGRFQGDMDVADFASIDKNYATDFVRWRAFKLAKIDVRSAPLAIAIGDVTLTDFYSRLILDEKGRLNLREIRRQPEAASSDEAQVAAQTSGGTSSVEVSPPAAPVPPISIGRITFEQGNIAYSDRFIQPNYDVNLTGMEGELVGLSSDPATLARLDLSGKVDNTAPVTVTGELNPFRDDRYLDISASVKDFDLPDISAYSGRYIGYGIRKGKLSAEVHYKIEDRKLTATNRLFLDQLTFGDKVDSPEAPNLPVQLAVSLLKNRAGEIDLNLPISGSLDDPQFSVAGLVVKAIINLIAKAITAPFALIGSMFGGGEELSQLDFAPGSSAIDARADGKIGTLAKALHERPALRLEITGEAERASDTEGLKAVMLSRMMKAAKLKALVSRGEEAPSLDEVVIAPDEYAEWLEKVYRDADFERPRNMIGLLKDVPEAQMKAMLLAHIDVDDEALRRLARERAQSVENRLLEKAPISPDRIFLLAPKVVTAGDGKDGGRSAVFSLK